MWLRHRAEPKLSLPAVSSCQVMKFHLHFRQRWIQHGQRKKNSNIDLKIDSANACPWQWKPVICLLDISYRTWVCLWGSCWSVQPKARTSSEESMAGEDDRTRKPSSLYAPTPLIRTSSGTHVRPKPHPRSSRHSGWLLHFASMSLNTAIYIISSNKSKIILLFE